MGWIAWGVGLDANSQRWSLECSSARTFTSNWLLNVIVQKFKMVFTANSSFAQLCLSSIYTHSTIQSCLLKQFTASPLLFCTGLSLAVIWVLKLYPDAAVSAVRADSREGEGALWDWSPGISFSDSSALYKWLSGAPGCFPQHFIIFANHSHLILNPTDW